MFEKYPKLRNSYDAKFVRGWVEHNPELRDCWYWITEKIHGSNWQVCVNPDGKITFGKRSGPITQHTKFYGYQEAWAKISGMFDKVKTFAFDNDVIVIIHG